MIYLSVIIPTWNSEKTISKALDSVLRQTFQDFEILVIDGLSSDKTLIIAKNYQDKRIKLFSEKDNGIYDAMNKGVRLAKGEWLYFLGSDDTIHTYNTFAEIEKWLNKTLYKVVYGDVKVIGNTNWAKDGELYDGAFNIEKLLCKNIAHQAIFYRKDVFKEYGLFNTRYKVCADYDFNLRLMSMVNFEYAAITIAEFNAGGLSSNVTDNNFRNDYASNVINYYHRYLNKPFFFQLRHDIMHVAVKNAKRLNIKRAIRFAIVASKFHIQHWKIRIKNRFFKPKFTDL